MEEAPQSESPTEDSVRSQKEVGFAPAAGCFIVGLAAAMFTGIAAFAIYAGVTQDRDIVGFTDVAQDTLEEDRGTGEEVAALRSRLETFADQAIADKPTRLELRPRDLNLLLANQQALADSRGMIYFTGIEDGMLTADLAMPINRLAFWKPARYLNARTRLVVEASEGRLFLRFVDFQPANGKTIQQGFVERIAQSDLLAPYKAYERVEAVVKMVRDAETTANAIFIDAGHAE